MADRPVPLMLTEAQEAPDRVADLLGAGAGPIGALAGAVRAAAPPFAVTVARGSSDHASAFARYLFETRLGLVTASAAPSVITVYGAALRMRGALALAVSQSGQSPDLLAVMRAATDAGALTAALVNDAASPLAGLVTHPVPLRAGPERAVAATKSFVTTVTAMAALTAALADADGLAAALARLPDALRAAGEVDGGAAVAALRGVDGLVTLARGLAFPIAQEMALKFKETCAIHAEPFSSAEFLHGPVTLVEPGFPVVVVAIEDPAAGSVVETARRLKTAGARLVVLSNVAEVLALADVAVRLPPPLHPALDPILAVQAFYPIAARLSLARGLDPDAPRHLSKVTRTR
jgi:glucosamine--fructose-6-phosphate aminotransferase (isomerizing)